MRDSFSRRLVLVVGDFSRGLDEVLALQSFGARVLAAGLGTAPAKRLLEAVGVSSLGIERSKRAATEAAASSVGGCDAVLFLQGVWREAVEQVRDAETQAAIADGRRMIPLVEQGDGRYRSLRSPREWAAFTLARAVGADPETAKEFAADEKRGHKKENSETGRRRSNRPATRAKRRGR
jgi:hypothetical protein